MEDRAGFIIPARAARAAMIARSAREECNYPPFDYLIIVAHYG